jgi:mannose-6-phosphate isomerase-like protein (cupin superfamily)
LDRAISESPFVSVSRIAEREVLTRGIRKMIKKENEQVPSVRVDVCGGTGRAEVLELFSEKEMHGRARMFKRIILEPGTSFGPHLHHDEIELYYILSGEVVTGEPGKGEILHGGDVTCTREEEAHFLRNETAETAELIAIILGVGTVENI